jgi:hypothetical protein
MSGKSVFLTSVVAAFLGLGVVHSQDFGRMGTSTQPGSPGSSLGPSTGASASDAGPPLIGPFMPPANWVSPWLVYPRSPCCAGPLGADGPISEEVYVQTGFSLPISGNYFGRSLGAGWDIEGGGRTHFFNKALDADWILGLSVSNVYNDAVDRTTPRLLLDVPNRIATAFAAQGFTFPALTPSVLVTLRDYNRTYFGLYGGREWYIWGSGEPDGGVPSWKWGINAGGRYGTNKLDVLQIRHLTDRIGALFAALHTEMELPWGPAIFSIGFWGEYSYTWSDVLQRQNNADLMELNLLFTVGARF